MILVTFVAVAWATSPRVALEAGQRLALPAGWRPVTGDDKSRVSVPLSLAMWVESVRTCLRVRANEKEKHRTPYGCCSRCLCSLFCALQPWVRLSRLWVLLWLLLMCCNVFVFVLVGCGY